MDFDFSHLNLEYLIQARDLAIADQHRASAILGVPAAIASILPDLPPHLLVRITRISHPLVTPRQDVWWWSRLLIALKDGHPEELETVMAHASLILGAAEEKNI